MKKKILKNINTVVILSMLVISCNTINADGAENKLEKNNKVPEKIVPIVIEADELYYSHKIGDIIAKGNVKITQNGEKLLTDLMSGNTKETILKIYGRGELIKQDLNLIGEKIVYNYGTHIGTIDNAKGVVGKENVSGKIFVLRPGYLEFQNGLTTSCISNKNRCYHISADRIEIWVGQKMIIYNAKFWIKNKSIYSIPKYKKSLKNSRDEKQPFP